MKSSFAISLVVFLVVLPGMATGEIRGIPEPGRIWADCGDQSPATYLIRAKNVACSTARKVARKAFVKMSDSRNFSRTRARGFDCGQFISHYDGAVYQCRKGRKEVRFYIGG
jgi:hypothetical protein